MRTPSAAILLLPGAAWAHHFMESELPRTLAQGFVSGLAHPIIGADHAAFMLAAGFLLALCRQGHWGLVALVLGSLAGAALHLAGADIPAGEAAVAISVIGVGVLLAARRALALPLLLALVAMAGVLHGHAYAESIFGAEPAPLAAYLAGFSLIQLAVASAALWLHRAILQGKIRLPHAAPVVGAAALTVGLAFLVA